MARDPASGVTPAVWVVGITAVISAMLLYTGWTSGEWRGVAITELQVVVVAVATYFGIR